MHRTSRFPFSARYSLAQLLNNQWFEIKFKANGLLHNPGNAEVTPISYSAVAYLRLTWDSLASNYDYMVRAWDGDAWRDYNGTDESVYGANEEILPNWYSQIYRNHNDYFRVTTHIKFKIKKDPEGYSKVQTCRGKTLSFMKSITRLAWTRHCSFSQPPTI